MRGPDKAFKLILDRSPGFSSQILAGFILPRQNFTTSSNNLDAGEKKRLLFPQSFTR